MNLRLTNPLRGSKEPWPLAMRITRFLWTASALLFMHIHTRTLERIVRNNTGFTDPQALPERPRRIASRLCMASTGFLFLSIVFAIAKRYDAIWALALAILLCALTGRLLRRTVWGLPNAFRERRGRHTEVLRRLVRVIRHGPP